MNYESDDESVCELCGGYSDDLHGLEIETAPDVKEWIAVCGWCDPPERS